MHIDSKPPRQRRPTVERLTCCWRTDWIEIDHKYEQELRYKASVIQEHPDRTVLSLPENDEACAELLQTLVDYLPKVSHRLVDAASAELIGIVL